MATEIEQEHALFALFAGFDGFVNGGPDRVRRLRSGNDTFGTCKQNGSFKDLLLRVRDRLDQIQLMKVTHSWRHTVVSQPSSVDLGWNECMTECVHPQKWCHLTRVSEVVTELTSSD